MPHNHAVALSGNMDEGLVFNIQRYSLHDGPGIRTTVFLKGCPLCCQWCHNPEGIVPRKEIIIVENRCLICGECRSACPLPPTCLEGPLPVRHPDCTQCGACIEACPTGARQLIGRHMTLSDVMDEILRDRLFYDDSSGGVTISGGEPLSQPRFLLRMLERCHAEGIHAALDTTGFGRLEPLLAAARLSKLILYDLKAHDETLHRKLTGVSNRVILQNLRELGREQCRIWIRLPIVPGFNDELNDLRRTAELVSTFRNVELVNLLPFHRSGIHKFQRLGRTHALDGVDSPSVGLMQTVAEIFHEFGLKTQVGG